MALQRRHHQMVRFLALAVAASSVAYMGSRARVRADVTQEGLSELLPTTRELIASIDEERPVTVHAFISEEVPREYETTRLRLLNLLREMEHSGGSGLRVRIVEPEVFSVEADEAMENYGIVPQQLVDQGSGRMETMEVFMGLAFVSGPNEEVVPFVDRGLSPEYEVARALRVVMQEDKKVLGIVRTDATIMGNFDLQSRRQQPAWPIVDELRKVYEVRSLNPGAPVPDEIDVVLVPQLSSLGQAELDNVRAYVDQGRPAFITIDPMPLFDVRLAPTEEKLPPPGQGGMMGQQQPPQPKGDYLGLLRDIGVEWPHTQVLYDTDNRPPMFQQAPPHITFVVDPESGPSQLGGIEAIEGFDQVVLMHPGEISPAAGFEDKFEPLLSSSRSAGLTPFDDMVRRHPLFGIQGPVPPLTQSPITGKQHVMAARITREGDAEGEGPKPRNVVVLTDLDMFGQLFSQMYEKGTDFDGDGFDDVRFDNVPFFLNLIDTLAGDDRFIELRKRQQNYRRLSKVDEFTEKARKQRLESTEAANQLAEKKREEAQEQLDAAVAKIQERTDLDETTKATMLKSLEETANRRLQGEQEKIEREKQRTMERIKIEHRRAVDEVQNRIRLFSVLIPPIPALLLGGLIFARKRRRERDTIPDRRRAPGSKGRAVTSAKTKSTGDKGGKA